MKYFALVALAAAIATAGCKEDDNRACPALAFVGPQLLYPIPGATGVPTASGSLLLAGNAPGGAYPQLVAAGVRMTLQFGPVPSPLPSPRATPSFAGEPFEGAAYASLASKTTYSLSYASTPTAGCTAPVEGSGSFTTR